MGLMTETLFRRNLEAFAQIDVETNTAGGWVVTFPWGRKLNIHETYIDLRGITTLLPAEKEDDREQLEFELMSLAHEVWGEVSMLGLSAWEYLKVISYAKTYGFPVDENQYRPFSKAHARHRFGEQAKVQRNWSPAGWRISLPDGSCAVIGLNGRQERTIDKVVGGNEVYAAAIRLVSDLQGYAIVRGTKENVLAGLAQGAAMDVEVIPELYSRMRSQIGIGLVCGTVFGWGGLLVGIASDHVGAGLIGGMVTAGVASMIWMSLISGGGVEGTRQRGQALKSAFPAVHGGDRKAGFDDARTRGML